MKRPMTPKGYSALRDELRSLKRQRPDVAKEIEVARGHGDLSENADYHAAKEKSGLIESKIRDLEAKLAHAEIINPASLKLSGRVTFGVSVKVADIDSGDERTLTIVGGDEADAPRGFISIDSPLARALIGKEQGDVATVQSPGGKREVEIIDIFLDEALFISVTTEEVDGE